MSTKITTMDKNKPIDSPDSTSVPQPTLDGSIGDGCRVLLIRHGRSADVVPGSPESADPPLHELGQQQAKALGERLATAQIDAVYSSHLLRALHTAQAVAAHHGLEVGIFEDLEEVRLGDWSNGEFRRRAATADPEYVEWAKTGTWDGIPNAEGDQNFRNRVATRINALAAKHDGGAIAVVCHGGVINAYVAAMLGTQRSLWMMVENTSITTVKLSETPSVLTLNDCSHLYDLLQK
jgi:broad specificity phosphatase PhoE